MIFVVVKTARGCSSVGRAPALQAGGQRFDPVQLHQFSIGVQVCSTSEVLLEIELLGPSKSD